MRLHCANGLVVQGAAQFRTLEGTLAGTKIHYFSEAENLDR